MLIAIIVMIQVLLIVPVVMVQDYWIKLRHLEMLSESVSQSALCNITEFTLPTSGGKTPTSMCEYSGGR